LYFVIRLWYKYIFKPKVEKKMSPRKEERLRKSFRIVLSDEGETYPAEATSISRFGMAVEVEHVFPTYKLIDVLVKIDNQVIPIKGSVRWVQEPPVDAEKKKKKITMGIALRNPPDEYLEHFE
jgi:hypothetical protein